MRSSFAWHWEFLQEVERQRRAWIEEWAAGDASGEAAHRLLLLHRLALAMADATALERLGGDSAAYLAQPTINYGIR